MKRKYYTGHDYADCEGTYQKISIVSVPLEDFTLSSMLKSFHDLSDNILLDDYTYNGLYNFYVWGFTEKRVNSAPVVSDSDSMILFAYTDSFKSPIGLAICFDGKFYAMDYSQGRRSVSELYNIFKYKKIMDLE